MEDDQLQLFKNTDEHEPRPKRRKPLGIRDRSFGKYIVYVDESGDHGIASIDENYPLFVLAFCIFHKGHYAEKVVPALEAFKFDYFGHDQVVLHEHEIRKEKGAFHIFPDRKAKHHFLEELTLIVEASNFILASCVIDKRRLGDDTETPDNPYHIALMHCVLSLYDSYWKRVKPNI